MAAVDRIRVLVVGDAGVGKTSFVHLMCHNKPIVNPVWTIGCCAEVKLHDYKAGTPAEKQYLVELWDIGGWSEYQKARSIFYNPVHGIILVHDLTNRKSQQNLRKWLSEIVNIDSKDVQHNDYDYDVEQFAGSSIPMLFIGTKTDLAHTMRGKKRHGSNSLAEECGAEEIHVDCTMKKSLTPGTSSTLKLSRFLDKVIDKYYNRDGNVSIMMEQDSSTA